MQRFAKYFCKILQNKGVGSGNIMFEIYNSGTLRMSAIVAHQRKKPSIRTGFVVLIIVAATYFTRFEPSIIGGSGLNFSVRDGKR